MTDSDTPWEPPLAGSEAEHLVGALERLRRENAELRLDRESLKKAAAFFVSEHNR
jgi:transposase-like protein